MRIAYTSGGPGGLGGSGGSGGACIGASQASLAARLSNDEADELAPRSVQAKIADVAAARPPSADTDGVLVATIDRLQTELAESKRRLGEAMAHRYTQDEEMVVLTAQLASLKGSVDELRQAAARQHERATGGGGVIGPLALDPDVQREVISIRRDWAAAARQGERSAAEAAEAKAEASVFKAEVASAESQLKQQRQVVESHRRQAIKAIHEAEVLRVELKSSQVMAHDLSASVVDVTAQLAMGEQTEGELKAALQEAEREVIATRQRGEVKLAECEAQRESEARAHGERVKLWERKLDKFIEMSKDRSMDLRTFVTNDPIYKALQQGLQNEAELARSYLERAAAHGDAQRNEEQALLNGRVSSLERANAALKDIRDAALQEARSIGAAGYEGSLSQLQHQIEVQRAACAEREELAAERERWAEEQIEIERRLFADAMGQVQSEHLQRHREATNKMVAARTRSVVLAERGEAVRQLLGDRGLQVWTRRLQSAVFRRWRDMYVRSRLARVESQYRLKLHQRVENQVREERRGHAEALNALGVQANALGTQLADVQAAARAELQRHAHEAEIELQEAKEEGTRMRTLAQDYLNALIGEVEAERERRELAERAVAATAHAVEGAAEAERGRSTRAIALAEERVAAAEAERAALEEELRVLRVGDSMAAAQREASEAERRRLQRRSTHVETKLRKEFVEAEDAWKEERAKLRAHIARLAEELRHVSQAAEEEVSAHQARVESAQAEREAADAKTHKVMSALREEVSIAGLAAQITAEHKDAELQSAYDALHAAKRSALRRLDVRWDRMLMSLAWQAWFIEHARIRQERADRLEQQVMHGGLPVQQTQMQMQQPQRAASNFDYYGTAEAGGGIGGGETDAVQDERTWTVGSANGLRSRSVGRSISFSLHSDGGSFNSADVRSGSVDGRTGSGDGRTGSGATSSLGVVAGVMAGVMQRKGSFTGLLGSATGSVPGGGSVPASVPGSVPSSVPGSVPSDRGVGSGGAESGPSRGASVGGASVGRGIPSLSATFGLAKKLGRKRTASSGAGVGAESDGNRTSDDEDGGGRGGRGGGSGGGSGFGGGVEGVRSMSTQQAEYEAALARYQAEMKEYEERLLPAYLQSEEQQQAVQQQAVQQQAVQQQAEKTTNAPQHDGLGAGGSKAKAATVATASSAVAAHASSGDKAKLRADEYAYEYAYEYDREDERDEDRSRGSGYDASYQSRQAGGGSGDYSAGSSNQQEDPWRAMKKFEAELNKSK